MQYFYINQNSINPTLRMEIINDGKFEFMKSTNFNNAIQNAEVTFSMRNENDVLKISKAPCTLVLSDEGVCNEHYIIEYQWKKHDTKDKGMFKGRFEIKFNDDLYEDGVTYPSGNLIMPIFEDLIIMIK
jgi:hypothetical protein